MDSKVMKLYEKINDNKDIFVVFGLSYCGYSNGAKKYLKNKDLTYKYYNIDKDYDIFFKLLHQVAKIDKNLEINPDHKTFPVIFYNKNFIGGYSDLVQKV